MSSLPDKPRAKAASGDLRSRIRDLIADDPGAIPKPSQWKSMVASASISMVVHGILLLCLSWIFFDLPTPNVLDSILSLVVSDKDALGDGVEIEVPRNEEAELLAQADVADEPMPVREPVEPEEPLFPEEKLDPFQSLTPQTSTATSAEGVRIEKPVVPQPKTATTKSASARKSTSKAPAGGVAEAQHEDHFVGRSMAGKAALLKRMGGTTESEAAVARGLIWLKNHQAPDGSWNFHHVFSPRCDCTMPGRLANNPNGATAMALLAFLGAGQTHESGEYQKEIQEGIDFLLSHGTPAEKGVCFYGQLAGPPTFYTHGLVTIALGEAFAMTHDPRIRPAIAGAVEFLSATQEPGGGWRYFIGQPGDTSVVAWQLMALKSAQFSRISVPQKVFTGVDRFLNGVASARGSQYAYMIDRPPIPSMTAAGLLCRMYLNWDENSGGLKAGIRYLDEHGPEPYDMYYNYYATQVLHHWGGPEWDRWNNVMREHLIRTQVRDGHATGSWDVADRHGAVAGGRLYMTSLALLTLEVYYRHLPLYQRDRVEIPLANPAADAKAR